MFGIGLVEVLVLLVVAVLAAGLAILAVVGAVRYARRQAERRYGPLDPRDRP